MAMTYADNNLLTPLSWYMFSVIIQGVIGKMIFIFQGQWRLRQITQFTGIWTVKHFFLYLDGLNGNLIFLGYIMSISREDPLSENQYFFLVF